jgi:hypothetical protein
MSPLKLMLVIPPRSRPEARTQEPAKPPAFDAGNYPPEVRKALRYADEECARQEGGAVTFAPDNVRKVDLTGDGRDDYNVDFRDTRVRRVFDGHVRTYEILPGDGARTIGFALHGGYCGGRGNPSCIKEHRITARPFGFEVPR